MRVKDLLHGRTANFIFIRHCYQSEISRFDEVIEKLSEHTICQLVGRD